MASSILKFSAIKKPSNLRIPVVSLVNLVLFGSSVFLVRLAMSKEVAKISSSISVKPILSL